MGPLTEINRLLPLLVVICAAISLIWTGVHHLGGNARDIGSKNSAMLDAEIAPGVAPEITKEAGAVLTDSTKLSAPDLYALPQRHLFGEVAIPKAPELTPTEIAKPVEPDFSDIPETRIPLKLSGIAFSPDKDRAFAMIITADGKQADYQAGEPIGNEASVHIIEERRVIIERDGTFESLSLPDAKNGAAKLAPPSRTFANRSQTRPTYNRPTPTMPTPRKQQ